MNKKEKSRNDIAKFLDEVSIHRQKEGKDIGFSETERQGTATSANLEENGNVSYSLKGQSPQGEQDTLTVCQRLISVLNRNGSNWSKPERGEGVVDCLSYDLTDLNKKIEIQVIRALINQELWKDLAVKGLIERQNTPIEEIVSDIKNAIDKKASDRNIPSNIRNSIILALDATRLPGHTLDQVVNKFRNKYSEHAISLAFRSIWIVGPTEALTSRLDLKSHDSLPEDDMTPSYSCFCVYDKPYCMWDWELYKKNQEFLEGLDSEYFTHLADSYIEQISQETDELERIEATYKLFNPNQDEINQVSQKYRRNRQRASTALRATYYHSLETLFAFIGASIQAPNAFIGWIHTYQNWQLRKLTREITLGSCNVVNPYGLDNISWDTIADLFFLQNPDVPAKSFSQIWNRLAHDFSEPLNVSEYNSIKHGLRLRSGGFHLSIGEEKEYGISPPLEEMKLVGGSRYGSTFHTIETLEGTNTKKYDASHFWARRTLLNWNPEQILQKIKLISASIYNTISFLKILNGIDRQKIEFITPIDESDFYKPWEKIIVATSTNFDYVINETDIKRFTPGEIIEKIRNKIGHK